MTHGTPHEDEMRLRFAMNAGAGFADDWEMLAKFRGAAAG